MPQNWYIGRRGGPEGPFAEWELKDLLEAGRVSREDYVIPEAGGQWVRLRQRESLAYLFKPALPPVPEDAPQGSVRPPVAQTIAAPSPAEVRPEGAQEPAKAPPRPDSSGVVIERMAKPSAETARHGYAGTLAGMLDPTLKLDPGDFIFRWLLMIAAAFVLGLAFASTHGYGDGGTRTVLGLLWAFLCALGAISQIQRLRDAGRSYWLILLSFVPIVNLIYLIMLCAWASKEAPSPQASAQAVPAE